MSWPDAVIEDARVADDAIVHLPGSGECPRCAVWGAARCETASGKPAKKRHALRLEPVLLAPLPPQPLDLRTLVNTRERTSPLDNLVTARIRRRAGDPQPDIRITPLSLDESEGVRRTEFDLDERDDAWEDFDLSGVVDDEPSRFATLDLD